MPYITSQLIVNSVFYSNIWLCFIMIYYCKAGFKKYNIIKLQLQLDLKEMAKKETNKKNT